MPSVASTPLSSSPSLPLQNPRISRPSRPRLPSAGSNWDSNAESIRTGRSSFNPKEFVTSDNDFGDGGPHGSGGNGHRRIWWSDESPVFEDDAEFGDWEDSFDTFWIFKILRAFGWMLPAVIISLLLGTGSNAFVMALALPLGQSALSLVIDKLWGSTSSRPSPRPRTKKRPFASTGSKIHTGEEKRDRNIKTGYQSRSATSDGSKKKGVNSTPSYGGWDELDKHWAFEKADNDPQRQQRKGKLSRRRNKEKPLLLRLIIAVFPFLESWGKLI